MNNVVRSLESSKSILFQALYSCSRTAVFNVCAYVYMYNVATPPCHTRSRSFKTKEFANSVFLRWSLVVGCGGVGRRGVRRMLVKNEWPLPSTPTHFVPPKKYGGCW